jgi:hypothetical protein
LPTATAINSRKLRSPRHFTWVLLEALDHEHAKPYVLVLTQQFKSTHDFKQTLGQYLVKKNPLVVFQNRPSEVLSAINTKTLIKNMRWDTVIRSRGSPSKISRQTLEGVRVERWQYGPNRFVILKNDKVFSWTGFPVLRAQEPE